MRCRGTSRSGNGLAVPGIVGKIGGFGRTAQAARFWRTAMRSFVTRPRALAVLLAGTALAFSPLGGQATAQLPVNQTGNPACFTPEDGAAARGGFGADHRDLSVAEQKAIDAKTAAILKAKQARGLAPTPGK